MWQLNEPKPVKLIIGILAADSRCLQAAVGAVEAWFGKPDLASEVWPFNETGYYRDEAGENIVRQFVSIERLIVPDELSQIKLKTNKIEQGLAEELSVSLSRPVNLDPGIIEPSKLVLASTKNYAHRIYIGQKIYAEVTLIFSKGIWQSLPYTYPDYRQRCYHNFFTKVRGKLLEQLKG